MKPLRWGKYKEEKKECPVTGTEGERETKRERRGGNRGQKRMRCLTMIDRFLAGSICHAVIGRKME